MSRPVIRAEDLPIGEPIELGSYTLSEAEVTDFGRAWDPLPIHTDPQAASRSPFGGLIASGVQVLAVYQRCSVESLYSRSTIKAGREVTHMRFVRPAHVGRTLHARQIVHEVTARPQGDHLVVSRGELRDDDGALIFEIESNSVWY